MDSAVSFTRSTQQTPVVQQPMALKVLLTTQTWSLSTYQELQTESSVATGAHAAISCILLQ